MISKANPVYHASGAAEALPLGMSKYLSRVKKVYDAADDKVEVAQSTNADAEALQTAYDKQKREEAKKAKEAEMKKAQEQ